MKRLVQIGNSWGLIIPKSILEVVKIKPSIDQIDVTIVNDEIRIKKADKDSD